MARSARKLVLFRLRTRFAVVTLLLALSEAGAIPQVPRIDGLGKKNCCRFLWAVSAHALHIATMKRYFSASRGPRAKSSAWYNCVLWRSDAQRYRGYMRMRRSTFDHVLGLLRSNAADLFVSRRGLSQLALEVQLALTLYGLGTYGHSARVEAVADLFGVSVGALVKSTRRVISGIKRLAPSCTVWPNADRRHDLSTWAGSRYGFDGSIGATDGITIPLAYAAALHAWAYYDRKGRYSLNAVIVCD